ncbi:hypothetical protein BJ912DRAFT_1052252 [Pholiota molesta]|nr:hypothetical protein BJ912DRAFT_1052252 [Pholiota molesta]
MALHRLPPELLDHSPPSSPTATSPPSPCQPASLPHARSLTAVLTLARWPHLARHVRSFAIHIAPDAQLLGAFYRKLSAALPIWRQLDHAHPRRRILLPPRPLLLAFHLDAHVAHFLNKAPALRELEVDDAVQDDAAAALHADALPLLAEFTGSSLAAQVLVPGRPVEHIHLVSGDLTEELAATLARSAAPILVLAAATSSHSVSLIGTLTRCMERLVHLRIVTTYNFRMPPIPPISPTLQTL